MLSRRDVMGLGLAAGCSIASAQAQQKASTAARILHARIRGAPASPAGSPARLGYDGSLPGPALRIRQGEELHVRLVNELTEPTAVHWHGLRLPNAMDGVPGLTQPPVEPGTSFDYRFRPPDAGTFWYHAHAPDQADAGLYGALIVEEREPVDADRDIVLAFGAQPDGRIGVNGAVRPDIPVRSGERVRLRLVNATGTQGLSLKVEGHTPWVMAIDGQPLEPFLPHEGRVGLAPGNRVDLFLDAIGAPGAMVPILSGAREETGDARLLYEPSTPASRRSSQPRALPNNPLPARIDLKNAFRADISISAAAAAAPVFSVNRGRPVNLAFRNPSGHAHVVHLHGHHFRLLDRLDDGWKPYWLDTLVVGELGERIAFVADNPGKWLIEWRMLDRRGPSTAVSFTVT